MEAEPAPHPGVLCKTHLIYEMTCAEYTTLYSRAHGCCEVCGVSEEDTPHGVLFIDHDRRYGNGAVRGLLCSRCNSRLGMLEDPRRHHAFDRDPRSRGLDRYLANAWFMQVARSARVLGVGLAAVEDGEQELIQATLRHPATRAATKQLRQGPTVRIRPLPTRSGSPFAVRAIYQPRFRIEIILHFEAIGLRKIEYLSATVERTSPPARRAVTRYDSWSEAVSAGQ